MQSYYNATELRITLTTDASASQGEFAIQCDTDSGLVSTADQDQYVRILGHPELTSIDPEESLIQDLEEVRLNLEFETAKVILHEFRNMFQCACWGKN